MSLYVSNNKYICEHGVECPYTYCPWLCGVSINKTDFSDYQSERSYQGWWHLPENSEEAEYCLSNLDI